LSKTSFQPILLHKYKECPPPAGDDEMSEIPPPTALDPPTGNALDSPPPPPPNKKLAAVIHSVTFDADTTGFCGTGGCLSVIGQEGIIQEPEYFL